MNWSPQQDAALKAVSKWIRDKNGPQIFRLFGWAGTGKSTLARHLAKSEKSIRKVEYMAFTGKAALVMRKNGCRGAGTIHSKIYKLENEEAGEPRFILDPMSDVADCDLVIVDEVSMVGDEIAKDLLSFGKKILVLGDPFQLPPVKGTGYFTECEPDIMLTEIHRQAEDNPIIRMSMDIREGRGLSYGSYGESKVISYRDVNQKEVMNADQILVGLNKTRIKYNDRARDLKGLPYRQPVRGDKLVCLKNNRKKNLLNGQIWFVKKMAHHFVKDYDLVLKPEDGFGLQEVYVNVHDAFFQGEEHKLDRSERKDYDEFYFGYALTVHKSQGSQWDNVYVFDESSVFREDAKRHQYTAVTRAAEKVTVVC